MVDLPASQAIMRTQKKPRKYIDPDAFHLARRKAGLTVIAAAVALDVDERTIRNYENGVVRIPYPSFRLIRSLAGFSLLGDKWEGWGFHQGKLWTPEGRSFEAHELRYIATYISIARDSIKRLAAATAAGPVSLTLTATAADSGQYNEKTPTAALERMAIGESSSATALFGAEIRQVKPQEFERSFGLQEKAA